MKLEHKVAAMLFIVGAVLVVAKVDMGWGCIAAVVIYQTTSWFTNLIIERDMRRFQEPTALMNDLVDDEEYDGDDYEAKYYPPELVDEDDNFWTEPPAFVDYDAPYTQRMSLEELMNIEPIVPEPDNLYND